MKEKALQVPPTSPAEPICGESGGGGRGSGEAGDLLTQVADAILVLDEEGRVAFANPAGGALFGRDPAELVGIHFGFPTMSGAGSDARHVQVSRPDGSQRVAEMRAGPTTWASRPACVATLRDITDRLAAERKLRDAYARLEAGEARYRLLAENVDDLITSHGADGEIRYASPTATALFSLAPAAMVGRHLTDFAHPDDAERARRCLETEPGTAVYRLAPKWSADRGEVWLETVIRKVAQGEGEAVAVTRDITDRVDLEQQLRHAQKMEAVGQLAGGVAHDFNNMLTVIGGYTDAITRRLDALLATGGIDTTVGGDLLDDAREIRRAAEGAHAVTRKLLSFSRNHVLRSEPLSLNDLLRDVEPMLRSLLGERCRLDLQVPDGLPDVRGDARQLEQVVVNLVVNARDAMPDGGTVTLLMEEGSPERLPPNRVGDTTAAHATSRAVRLRVTDTGVGMDAETRARIFEPFFTTKSPDKGTGLGLSTVFGIMRQHRGRIEVTSRVGEGTTFELLFPAEPAAKASATNGPPDEDAPPRESAARVLLAEDQARVRKLVCRILESEGYLVVEAPDGKVALQRFEATPDAFDLILSDVVMPGMDGPTLVGHARTRRPDVRVLLMSGYTNGQLHVGGDGQSVRIPPGSFLQKPFTLEQLVEKVRAALSRPA